MRYVLVIFGVLLLVGEANADKAVAYHPGFYRLATKAHFVGRIRIESVSKAGGGSDEHCGLVHEAVVMEAFWGAAAGTRIRFVARVKPDVWPAGTQAFAMLFAHALPADEPAQKCWLTAAPIFAAVSPASVVAIDARAGQELGGEFLAVRPDNVLAGLRFAAVELWRDGSAHHFASWELVRAYARQTPAVVKAIQTMPEKTPPPDAELPPRE
jgi:hypothetical protein